MSDLIEISKSIYSKIAVLSITFLFFIELSTRLVESIYMLDLLNLALDEKVLGLLFFFSPILLVFLKKDVPEKVPEILVTLLFICRILTPLLKPSYKIISSGIGVAGFLLFLPLYLSSGQNEKERSDEKSFCLGVALAFAVLLLILFRASNSTVDISMYKNFQIIGWGLAGLGVFLLFLGALQSNRKQKKITKPNNLTARGTLKVYLLILGLIGILLLSYFALNSPTVIARWTEGNYIAITLILSGAIVSFIILIIKTGFFKKVNKITLLLLNAAFIFLLFLTIYIHTVPFPSGPEAEPVFVNSPSPWYYSIPLFLMLILSPVIFVDFILVTRELRNLRPKISTYGTSFTLGGLFFILMALILIFTNVWGYIGMVSLIFRNLFWLPFLGPGIIIVCAVVVIQKQNINLKIKLPKMTKKIYMVIFSLILFGGISTGVLISTKLPSKTPSQTPDTLTVFTYNVQQGVNISGEKNYDNQLQLIREIDPDIIGLQECDTARISGGNSDLVRYFQNKLSAEGEFYYSYYGPKTVTGTYGTALLSKYPINDAKVFFTYSDVDEIGTTEVELQMGDKSCVVFVNHPAGSQETKLAHVNALKERAKGRENVIALGDFNFRQDSVYYNEVVSTLDDAWLEKWPNATDDLGLNMTDRIDHIFISEDFSVNKARFITEPQSDHPALWSQVGW
ncbi:MAG: endonuclease/exonuclease/phosphatase family protein [Promethearchaeia archaeon]